MDKMLAQAKPIPTMLKMSQSGSLIKYNESSPIPPMDRARMWTNFRLVILANGERRNAKIKFWVRK